MGCLPTYPPQKSRRSSLRLVKMEMKTFRRKWKMVIHSTKTLRAFLVTKIVFSQAIEFKRRRSMYRNWFHSSRLSWGKCYTLKFLPKSLRISMKYGERNTFQIFQTKKHYRDSQKYKGRFRTIKLNKKRKWNNNMRRTPTKPNLKEASPTGCKSFMIHSSQWWLYLQAETSIISRSLLMEQIATTPSP